MADEALRQAREADQELAAGHDRGPLHGVPISIKDLLDIRGVPTTAASRVREGTSRERDAPTIAHLRQAGAVFVGKTNLHEFAFGTTSEDSAFGPARNPHDPTRSPGGSSGGSAASVAAGMALGHHRHRHRRIDPHSRGRLRHRRTEAVVRRDVRSTASCRCRGRSITSARWRRRVDRREPRLPRAAGRRAATPPAPMPIHGLRLAVPRRISATCSTTRCARGSRRRSIVCAAAGARIDEIEIRHAPDIAPIYLHIVLGDAAAYHAPTLETMPERYTPAVRLRLEMARYVLAEDYVRALAGRERLMTGGGRGAGAARCADSADTADSGAAARREHGAGRRGGRARSQPRC